MDACNYEFSDGSICCQVPGHLNLGVPHLRWDESAMYWSKRRAEEAKILNEIDEGSSG